MKKLLIFLITLSLCSAFLISCSRVQKQKAEFVKGNLKTVKLKNPNLIPIEYGALVSITTDQAARRSFLWFVDDDETVRVAIVDLFHDKLYESVFVIPRN